MTFGIRSTSKFETSSLLLKTIHSTLHKRRRRWEQENVRKTFLLRRGGGRLPSIWERDNATERGRAEEDSIPT